MNLVKIRLDHNYPDRHVRLHVFEVNDFSGIPHGKEGQAIQWVQPQECSRLDFLEANKPIVDAVLLPKLILITDIAKYGLEQTLTRIDDLQQSQGSLIVQLRENTSDTVLLNLYKTKIEQLLKHESFLILNGEPSLAQELGFSGIQLSSRIASRVTKRAEIKVPWVSASCHESSELRHAEKIADFALLSPIQATTSHPNESPKGWNFFKTHAQEAALPVYALGGLSTHDFKNARLNQAQGVAILSAAWS